MGEAIDRAVTMVRGPSAAAGVNVDEVTAALIGARFDVRRDGRGFRVYEERLSLDPTRPLLGKPTSTWARAIILEEALAGSERGRGPRS